MADYVQIQWTAANLEEARKVGHLLVEKRLAACVNMIPAVESIFSWEGKIESEKEVEVLIKTRETLFDQVKTEIELHSSYEVPAILMFPIIGGNELYLNWLDESTQRIEK